MISIYLNSTRYIIKKGELNTSCLTLLSDSPSFSWKYKWYTNKTLNYVKEKCIRQENGNENENEKCGKMLCVFFGVNRAKENEGNSRLTIVVSTRNILN